MLFRSAASLCATADVGISLIQQLPADCELALNIGEILASGLCHERSAFLFQGQQRHLQVIPVFGGFQFQPLDFVQPIRIGNGSGVKERSAILGLLLGLLGLPLGHVALSRLNGQRPALLYCVERSLAGGTLAG